MPHESRLYPGSAAMSAATAIAPASSTISIATTVPRGLAGDQTFAPASVKNAAAVRASATVRTCGITTPSAPSARTSFTRARVSASPAASMVGMRTSSVGRRAVLLRAMPATSARTASASYAPSRLRNR